MAERLSDGPRDVLITGAGGFVGRQLVAALAADRVGLGRLIATDLRLPKAPIEGVEYKTLDIRDAAAVDAALAGSGRTVDVVVHLAAVVTPGKEDTREFQRQVDVGGTRNLLDACAAHGVKKLVYTSSGAAYGYYADNAALLDEDAPLRGNEVFAYAWHKRLVEEMLAEHRAAHPELAQLIFRVSTILGPSVHNQITAMFERPVVLGLRGVDTPFCFVDDADVVECLARGARGDQTGVFNLTGDGVMTLREIAAAMGRRFVALPAGWVERGLKLLHGAKLSPYGPEQVLFLQHRPVLYNQRLKAAFGDLPRRSSREVFARYRESRA